MPELQTWQWILGTFCAFMIGVAKTGVPGIGAFIVPVMVLMIGDARLAAAWTVPMLTTGDLFAVAYWRRHANLGKLIILVPWVGVGMAGGALALFFPEGILRRMVGSIILLMVGVSIVMRRHTQIQSRRNAFVYGIGAGFATTIANSAGPFMNLYLLVSRLPKEQFIATAAWFFLVVNLAKVPIYAWHQLYSRDSLTFAASMVPVVVVGNLSGVWLIRKVDQRTFEILIIVLTAAASVSLLL